jgi:hypothetical protein
VVRGSVSLVESDPDLELVPVAPILEGRVLTRPKVPDAPALLFALFRLKVHFHEIFWF